MKCFDAEGIAMIEHKFLKDFNAYEYIGTEEDKAYALGYINGVTEMAEAIVKEIEKDEENRHGKT